MSDLYRVSVSVLQGPHESDGCFQDYMAQDGAEVVYATMTQATKVGVAGELAPSEYDRAWYIWRQTGALVRPASCTEFHTADLLTAGGKNGWATLAEAKDVLEHHLGKLADLDAMAAVGYVDPLTPAAITKAASEGATELAADAGEVAEKAIVAAEKVALKVPWPVYAGLGILAIIGLGYTIRSVR